MPFALPTKIKDFCTLLEIYLFALACKQTDANKYIIATMKRKNRSIMENKPFTYNYSAVRNKEVESIRRKYLPEEESKLETLKRLDYKVQSAGMIESLCIGIIGALVFGIGMCFFLEVFAGVAWLTALFMIIGTLLMIPAYPIYRRIAHRTKEKLTPEILRLSEEIMKS